MAVYSLSLPLESWREDDLRDLVLFRRGMSKGVVDAAGWKRKRKRRWRNKKVRRRGEKSMSNRKRRRKKGGLVGLG